MIRFVRQEGLRDCGVCALLNIIRYYGGNIDIEKLRKLTNTNENGTSIYNLVNTSNKLGFNSKAYKCDIEHLYDQTFPLVAYIKIKDFYHYVILLDIDIDNVYIFDPIRGNLKYSILDFEKEWQKIIITFDRKGDLVKEKNIYSKYLSDLFNKYKKSIISLVCLSFLCTIITIINSFYMRQIFDMKVVSKSFITFMIFISIKGGIDYIRNKQSIKFNNDIELELSSKLTSKIFLLSEEYHHSRPVGDIIYRINDLNNIKDFINTITIYSIIDIFSLVICLLVIIFISFTSFLLITFIIFLSLIVYQLFRIKESNYLNEVKESYSDYSAYLVDNLYGINTIKNYNNESKVIDKKNKLLKNYIAINSKFKNYLSTENLVFNYIESFGLLIIMFIGYSLIKGNHISVGDLALIYSLFMGIYSSLKNLIILDKTIIQSKLSFNRINSFLNKDDIKKKNLKNIDSINKISFNSNDIVKGDIVLIHGESGIGKSTIFRNINKEINSLNNIYVNDINIKEITKDSIRKEICYVSQNEYIFNTSIKNNILLGNKINPKDLEKALRVSTLNKVLKKKNINLDYLLEENGHNLSGGERKKILIARGLVQNTNYIVFDETFDEIDINTEKRIINNIRTEYKKTIVVISHRCSNLELYNKVIEIK